MLFLSRRPRCHFITTESFINALLLSSVKGEVSQFFYEEDQDAISLLQNLS